MIAFGIAIAAIAAISADVPRRATAAEPPAGGAPSAAAIDGAIARAGAWLLAHQGSDGGFDSPVKTTAPRVATTSMALWALAESRAFGGRPDAVDDAARYILGFRQKSGGIYDPRAGLAVYTSAVANRALEAWGSVRPSPELKAAVEAANLFVYRAGAPESYRDLSARPPAADLARATDRLLARKGELPEAVRRSLEFLKETQGGEKVEKPRHIFDGGPARPADDRLTYDDLLRYIYELARRDNPSVYKAYKTLQESYTLEKNPDLSGRWAGGLPQPKAGLHYYYLTVARTMSALGQRKLTTKDGVGRDWVRELGDKLLGLQAADGSWTNSDGRWWEDDPVLVTAYGILTLDICRKMGAPKGAAEEKR
jgi:hypothetical protein